MEAGPGLHRLGQVVRVEPERLDLRHFHRLGHELVGPGLHAHGHQDLRTAGSRLKNIFIIITFLRNFFYITYMIKLVLFFDL